MGWDYFSDLRMERKYGRTEERNEGASGRKEKRKVDMEQQL